MMHQPKQRKIKRQDGLGGWMAVPPLSPQTPRPSLSSSPLALLRSRRRGRDRPPPRRPCISPFRCGSTVTVAEAEADRALPPSLLCSPPLPSYVEQRGVHPSWHGRRRHPHTPQRLQGRLHRRPPPRRRVARALPSPGPPPLPSFVAAPSPLPTAHPPCSQRTFV